MATRSVAAASTPAASTARGHGGCHHTVGLHPEDRQLAHHVGAGAVGAGHGGRRAGDVPLEVVLAGATAIFVDGHRLLATSLHVALHELFGVLLENVVDLIEELVDVFLDLLALLGDLAARCRAVTTAFGWLGGPCFLSLLLSHLALHRAWVPSASPPRVGPAALITYSYSN